MRRRQCGERLHELKSKCVRGGAQFINALLMMVAFSTPVFSMNDMELVEKIRLVGGLDGEMALRIACRSSGCRLQSVNSSVGGTGARDIRVTMSGSEGLRLR